MTQEEILYSDSSQRQHNEIYRHESDMNYHFMKEEYGLFALLRPKIYQDGNQWCVLYGENIQDGVCGFGSSPYKAILDFNLSFNEEIKDIEDEN